MITQHVLDSMNEVITNEYDQNHKALDIVASDRAEANIIALESGTVKTVVDNFQTKDHSSQGLDTYGNYIQIKQPDGKTALYAHIKYNSIEVKEGDFVEKGTKIGTIGETGNAYGKHLHLEIKNENNVKENPYTTLTKTYSKEENSLKNNEVSKEETTSLENDEISKEEKIVLNNENNTYQPPIIEYLHAENYHHGSIVDALKSLNVNSSYNYRKKLAQKNGIDNYKGSYSQNVKLLKMLKNGTLKKA